jgi:hypothetical protein
VSLDLGNTLRLSLRSQIISCSNGKVEALLGKIVLIVNEMMRRRCGESTSFSFIICRYEITAKIRLREKPFRIPGVSERAFAFSK